MIRKAIPNTLIIAIFLLAPISANAAFWIITDTAQNGDSGALGFDQGNNAPTLGFTGWSTIDPGLSNVNHAIYAQGIGPGYACYGLTPSGNTTCADAGTPVIWDPNPAVFSGSVNDDGSFLDLSWTGQVGTQYGFGLGSLFTASILSGSYDANGNVTGGVDAGAGYDADGLSCWNDPTTGLPGPPDLCGNGTGGTIPTPSVGVRTIADLFLPNGLSPNNNVGFGGVRDNGDGTITIDMSSSAYTDCVNDTGCTPGGKSADIFAQWRVNATKLVPIPAAIWLLGSALGMLGWLRRKQH
jgi:hypothetical protein